MSDIATQRRIRGIEDTIDRLRTMAQGIAIGTSMPTNPSANDLVYRTDLGFLCYYDGTRWLTIHEYSEVVTPYTTTNLAVGQNPIPIRTDFAPYISRIVVPYNVATTNNGSNYWIVDVQGLNLGITAATTFYSFNTSGTAAGVWGASESNTTSPTPTNRQWFRTGLSIGAGAPGAITFACTVYYRVVIT